MVSLVPPRANSIGILANKEVHITREMLSRTNNYVRECTILLQLGTKALNKGSIDFENNSRIIASATTTSSIRGLSVNLLYLDEFVPGRKCRTVLYWYISSNYFW